MSRGAVRLEKGRDHCLNCLWITFHFPVCARNIFLSPKHPEGLRSPVRRITWARYLTLRQFDHGANCAHAFGAEDNSGGGGGVSRLAFRGGSEGGKGGGGWGASPLAFMAWYVVSNETSTLLANLTCYLTTDSL